MFVKMPSRLWRAFLGGLALLAGVQALVLAVFEAVRREVLRGRPPEEGFPC